MKEFTLLINKNIQVGKIENGMFSSFIEHLGRAIYGGMYQPDHPSADEDGFRKDVIEVIKPLNLNLIRYPGGNFVSGYFWEDGIGPVEKRPQKIDHAWHSIEPNIIGTDEFMKWAKKVNVSPMMALNLGSGTIESARNLVEYCNANDRSKYANLRRQNGHNEPYNIIYWCLGNEMDGDWQIGHMSVEDYILKAKKTAQEIRKITPEARLIACGSSTIDMPSFPSWDRQVLEGLYDDIDLLAVHQYFYESTTEDDFFASYLAVDKYITTLRNVLGYVKASKRSKKDIYLCFDEYNIWYNTKKLPQDYRVGAPRGEEFQSLKDALVFTGILNSLLNNADIIKVACLAQLINVLAPIMTRNDGGVLLNSIYYPFFHFCNECRGIALKSYVTSGESFNSRFGEASYLSQSVVLNEDKITINLSNYAKEEVRLMINLLDFGNVEFLKGHCLFGEDLNARNTFEHPKDVVLKKLDSQVTINNNQITIALKPLSWTAIQLKLI